MRNETVPYYSLDKKLNTVQQTTMLKYIYNIIHVCIATVYTVHVICELCLHVLQQY